MKDAVDDAVTRVVKAAGGNDRATAAESTIRTVTRPKPGQRAAAFVNDVVDNMAAAVTKAPDRTVVIEKTREVKPVECPMMSTRRSPSPTATNVPYRSKNRQNYDWYGTFARRWPRRSGRTSLWSRRRQRKRNRGRRSAAATDRRAAGDQRHRHRDLQPDLVRRGRDRGTSKALPGSGVRVERSTLTIGDQEVPADWYFPDTYHPESTTPPERIIYLQHGFGARGVFYDYTASYLAKQTNSIVVAPTVTSNLFATDGMWLGGDPMHQDIAKLFNDDNPALLKSATGGGLRTGPITAAGRARRAFTRRRGGAEHRPVHGGDQTRFATTAGGRRDARRSLVHRSRGTPSRPEP